MALLTLPSRAELRARPLFTPRVMLSPLDGSSAREMFEQIDASRAELAPWLPWVPFTLDAHSSLQFAEASAAEWDAQRAHRLVIRDRQSHTLLGVVSLERWSLLHRSAELGYWLTTSARGRGLMTEAAGATLRYAFERANAHRVRVAAATDNHASLKVIHRLRFRFEGIARAAERCDGRWLDHAVFARLASDP